MPKSRIIKIYLLTLVFAGLLFFFTRQPPRELPPPTRTLRRPRPSSPTFNFAPTQKHPEGISYEHYAIREVPWSVHVIRIDRSNTNFDVITTLGRGTHIGLSSLTRQIRSVPPELGAPVAAINGDFYRLEGNLYEGDPRGLHILRGELVSAPSAEMCFWIDQNGSPQMDEVRSRFAITWPNGEQTRFGLNEERTQPVLYTAAVGESTRTYGGTELILERVPDKPWLPLRIEENFPARIREVRHQGDTEVDPDTLVLSFGNGGRLAGIPTPKVGDVITISTETEPSLKGTRTALGGGPRLVHNGKASPGHAFKSGERHPRSAVGWNAKEFLFVEVDGRQPGLSMGMSVPELAQFMEKLGCDEAMNLDGGGSAELWMKGEIVNSPCFGRERSTATALVVVDKRLAAKP